MLRRGSALLLGLAACTSQALPPDSQVRDANPPTLEVKSPVRGSMVSGQQLVVVSGKASDDESGLASVMVNDVATQLDADGSWKVTLPVSPGMNLLHTVATDKSGNKVTDTRAVLAGNLVRTDTAVANAMSADISRDAIHVMGDVAGKALSAVNLTQVVGGMNPVVNVGITCLNAKVNVTHVNHGAIAMTLEPTFEGLSIDADIANLDVGLDVPYEAACIDGDEAVTMTAQHFHLTGTVSVDVVSGALKVDIIDAASDFTGFHLTADYLPSAVENLISAPVGSALSAILADQIKTRVPPQVQKLLSGFGSDTLVPVFGQNLSIGIKPTAVHFDTTGGRITLDSKIYIPASAGSAVYLSNPSTAPGWAGAPQRSIRLAVADDAMNQLVASFWGAGVLDRELTVSGSDYGGLGVLFDRVDVSFLLPPVATALPAGQGLKVSMGDVVLAFVKKDDAGVNRVITKLAVSAEATFALSMTAQNTFNLTASEPVVWIDTLTDGVDGSNPFNNATFEALGSFAAKNAVGVVSKLVQKLPVPSFQGATVMNGTVTTGETAGGYLMVSGDLKMQ